MKYKWLHICFIVSAVNLIAAQDIIYYPLQVDNRWEFRNDQQGELCKIVKDSTMGNGKTYAMKVITDRNSKNNFIGDTLFERFESNKVYRYNSDSMTEKEWFDFEAMPGDTINTVDIFNYTWLIVLDSIVEERIIGKKRKIWKFKLHRGSIQWWYSINIADSIGIVQNGGLNTATAAVIDSVLMREQIASIYWPMQPGNWWSLKGFGVITVVKDTIMANGKKYFELAMEGRPSDYLRQEENYIYRYTEFGVEQIEIDFSAPKDQTYNFIIEENPDLTTIWFYSSWIGLYDDIVFNENRRVFNYFVWATIVDCCYGYTIADSIGIILAAGGMGNDYEVSEAFVNNTLYTTTSIETGLSKNPANFILYQNYPNPFNPVTTIHYQLAKTMRVELDIYTISGQKVTTLISEKQQVGNYSVKWDASDFASGVYIYTLEAGNGFKQSKKLVLIK